jgi:hypothetical protein
LDFVSHVVKARSSNIIVYISRFSLHGLDYVTARS